ncbi:MAG: RNA-directed DNA polymerase, partial [Bacteroidales bacterium]|nr:RNA-directed DNA polymerase [Bacteroidales bacterium]
MSLIDDLFDAYFDARYTKRNSRSQLGFELCYESNLFVLAEQLQNRSYTLSPGKCFITDIPVKREIYASLFKDRVVHHLLFNYLAPLFEKQFIYDSYSCRVGKGTLFGVKRFDHHLRSVTENYTKQAYILQLDIRGYFMSINRAKLYEIIQRRLGRCSKKDLEGLD